MADSDVDDVRIDSEQFLVFQLGVESYAITINNVVEVLEFKRNEITRIPRTPAYMVGVKNNRGRVTPIINLRLQLGMDDLDQGEMENIIILKLKYKGDDVDLGVLVDSVKEVNEFSSQEVEPRPKLGNKVQPEFIQGIANKNGEFVILLDVSCIFNIEILSHLKNTTLITEDATNNLVEQRGI